MTIDGLSKPLPKERPPIRNWKAAGVGSSKKVAFPQMMTTLTITTCHLELSPGRNCPPAAGPGHGTERSQQTPASNSLTQVPTPGWVPRPFPVSTCRHLSAPVGGWGPWSGHFSHLYLSLKTSYDPSCELAFGGLLAFTVGSSCGPSRLHPGSYRGCSRRFSPPPLGSLRVPLAGGPCRSPRPQL